MKKTGVANPELAADLITQHERSSILLSETSKKSKVVAQGMQEIISQVEMTIHDSSNVMEQVASALLIIHDEHQEQMRRLEVQAASLEECMGVEGRVLGSTGSGISGFPQQNVMK